MGNLLNTGENSLQKQFEDLSYKDKISVLETVTGSRFTGANIKGIQLFEAEEYSLGSCGLLSSHNRIASFDICGVVKVGNMVVNNKRCDGYDINIVNFKNIQRNPNYEKIYKYYRCENDWHYDKKMEYYISGSAETRDFTERRRYSTVDQDAIHVPEVIYKSILDSIYEKKDNQSLNAKRLQMIYTLNLLVNNKKLSSEYVSSHYNFNIRNCDLVRQRTKR